MANDGVNQNSVSFPSRVKALYLEFSIAQFGASNPAGVRIIWVLWKDIGNRIGQNNLDPSDIEGSALGSQVIRAGQMRVGTYAENRYVFAGWIPIPKRHQIFNENDQVNLTCFSAGAASQICGICTYKWEH